MNSGTFQPAIASTTASTMPRADESAMFPRAIPRNGPAAAASIFTARKLVGETRRSSPAAARRERTSSSVVFGWMRRAAPASPRDIGPMTRSRNGSVGGAATTFP